MTAIIGFESSCDETAVAVVVDGRKVLSNAIASQIAKHAVYGGVVPELAAREHLTAIRRVTDESLKEAGVTTDQIDAVAVTNGPGLVPALLVGVNFAKGFAAAYKKPLIGINHFLGHIYGVDATDERDVTRGYVEGRRVAEIIHDFYRRRVPGYEYADLTATAALLGVRESRRICGDYRLCFADYLARRHFADDIGCFCYPVDIHASTPDAARQKRVAERMRETAYLPGENYGIPYRALIPAGIANLLVPGRAISSDRPIQSSIRVMPPCFVTGQAAGIAATLAAGQSDVRAVDTAVLQQRLAELGACFSQRRE